MDGKARQRRPIDRDEVLRRLAPPGEEESARRAARLLEARARALAAPPAPAAPASIAAVGIDAGGERFAVDAAPVSRVQRVAGWARLPGAPGFVLGLLASGERTVPLLDLAALLGGAGSGAPARWAVVLGEDGGELALAADAVALLAIRPDALHPAPGDDGVHLRRGLTEDARLVLDGAALLAHAGARLRAEVR